MKKSITLLLLSITTFFQPCKASQGCSNKTLQKTLLTKKAALKAQLKVHQTAIANLLIEHYSYGLNSFDTLGTDKDEWLDNYFSGKFPRHKALQKNCYEKETHLKILTQLENIARIEFKLQMLEPKKVKNHQKMLIALKTKLVNAITELNEKAQTLPVTRVSYPYKPNPLSLIPLQYQRLANIAHARTMIALVKHAEQTGIIADELDAIVSEIYPYCETIRLKKAELELIKQSFPYDPNIIQYCHLITILNTTLNELKPNNLSPTFPSLLQLSKYAVRYYHWSSST